MGTQALQNSTWQIIKLYLRITTKNNGWLFLVFVGFGTASIVELLVVKFQYKRLIDAVVSANSVTDTMPILISIGVILVTGKFVTHFAAGLADFRIAKVETENQKIITDYCFNVLMSHSYSFYADNFVGSLVAKTKRFASAYNRLVARMLFNFSLSSIELIVTLSVAWSLSAYLGAFFTAWILVYVTSIFFFARYKQPFHGSVSAADSSVTSGLADAIGNFLAVKVFAATGRESTAFQKRTRQQWQASYTSERLDCFFRTFQALSVSGLEVAGMAIVVYLWTESIITAGTIVLMQTYFIALTGRLWELRRAIVDFYKDIADADEMVTILTTPPSVQDVRRPKQFTVTKGLIEFNNLTFGYGSTPLFTNFNLQVQPKQRVGIVGSSGSGKSTLFKLLLRFVDITSGAILIDGQDVKKVRQSAVRESIGYVSQEPYLFHRSLYENIAYGKPNATKQQVVAAAKKAHAHQFIQTLPNGYNTLVGERGVKLSGGERQRVSLARIILHNAPILLLDEATSALDSVSEQYIQSHLQTVMKGKTALVIAHRISTIQQLDRILVLEHGNIVEDGTHASLLRKKGVYASLWNHQSDGYIGIE